MNPSALEPISKHSQQAIVELKHTSPILTTAWREYNGKHASQKRRACNECRQQKLKCDLANDQNVSVEMCARCAKLGLLCKVDETFQRTRKRKRSHDFQEEIADLKRKLSIYQDRHDLPQSTPSYAPGDETPDRSAPGRISASPVASKTAGHETKRTPSLVNNGLLPPSELSSTSPDLHNGRQPSDTIATRPHEHELEAPTNARTASASRPRSLGNGVVTLSQSAIDELYSTYFELYHPTLPILDPEVPAQRCCDVSPLLFWSIMSVAVRRSWEHSQLLPTMAQPVMDLLWKAIRSVPHSPVLIESLLLLCTWPFPTSSSATDPSYILSHTAVAAAVQMGLHRPQHQQDFTKYRLNLSRKDMDTRITLWAACNIVANGTSLVIGVQSQAQDWSSLTGLLSGSETTLPKNIQQILQTELYRDKVTSALADISSNSQSAKHMQERIPLYGLLEKDWNLLSAMLDAKSDLIRYHVLAARLHLHAFFLFDDPTTEDYDRRILVLVASASALIQHILSAEPKEPPFMPYCSFYAYQSLPLAGFILLKVVRSEYFAQLIGSELATARHLLEACIRLMRVMSVSDNDLALRLSDVLAYLYNHNNPRVVCAEGRYALQLNIQSRLSMSIVFDCLWRWRDQFRSSNMNRDGTSALDNGKNNDWDNGNGTLTAHRR
jgi:transcriptional regulatory protein LEU3